jgi:hypothetical protein
MIIPNYTHRNIRHANQQHTEIVNNLIRSSIFTKPRERLTATVPTALRQPLGLMQAQLLPAGAGSLEAVPLIDAHQAGGGTRGGQAAVLRRPRASHRSQSIRRVPCPAQKNRWFVYAKRPFAGPKAVLACLSRYTHRVAISNRRLRRWLRVALRRRQTRGR